MGSSVAAEIGGVYWTLDGGIHHATCRQRMVLRERHPPKLVFACVGVRPNGLRTGDRPVAHPRRDVGSSGPSRR